MTAATMNAHARRAAIHTRTASRQLTQHKFTERTRRHLDLSSQVRQLERRVAELEQGRRVLRISPI
jgi:hypothetical protein